ncbi:MAG: TIGR03790 family protein [Planctomycetota bacterium]
MSVRPIHPAAILILLLPALPARALTPEQTVVVANAASADSVELARHYVKVRNVPAENLVLLRTTTDYEISREDFDKQIRRPLQVALADRGLHRKVRAMCLIYGIPVRVAAPSRETESAPHAAAWRKAVDRLHGRLVTDYQLLGTIGRKFPAPQTETLRPVGKLFAETVRLPDKPYPSPQKVVSEARRLISQRTEQLDRIGQSDKRRIAARQLMAIQLDLFGLQGLVEYIEAHDLPAEPAVQPLRERLAELRQRRGALEGEEMNPEQIDELLEALHKTGGLSAALAEARRRGPAPGKNIDADASVDSELALLWYREYKLDRWLPNPLHWQVGQKLNQPLEQPVLMTARIDGPTRADVRRMINASVSAEQSGLDGRFYIDSGGKVPEYDYYLKSLDRWVGSKTRFPVTLEPGRNVLGPGEAPQAALYVGWYSLQRYIPAFTWAPGAVGWHIASFEAMHLRDPDSKEWCVKMIQNGVAATVGAVDEPRLGAFPRPDHFFPLLMTGKYTLAECYWRTSPFVSWRMTLIGDPLYNPFQAKPAAKLSDLPEERLALPQQR